MLLQRYSSVLQCWPKSNSLNRTVAVNARASSRAIVTNSDDNVIVRKDGPVTIITINRNSVRNAVDKPTGEKLRMVFEDFDKDDNQSVAVLTGSGGTFCAG